jgi:rare lipoprotein A
MRREKSKDRILPLTLIFLITLFLFALLVQAQDTKALESETVQAKVSTQAKTQKVFLGKATYYANRYQGRKTSSGEIFDQRKMTAAHPTLPHGTRVKVENLANNRSVMVKVNDRLNKRKYEIIDLSRAAARKLDILKQGVATVRITPFDE